LTSARIVAQFGISFVCDLYSIGSQVWVLSKMRLAILALRQEWTKRGFDRAFVNHLEFSKVLPLKVDALVDTHYSGFGAFCII
jgi:hypothetical protein